MNKQTSYYLLFSRLPGPCNATECNFQYRYTTLSMKNWLQPCLYYHSTSSIKYCTVCFISRSWEVKYCTLESTQLRDVDLCLMTQTNHCGKSNSNTCSVQRSLLWIQQLTDQIQQWVRGLTALRNSEPSWSHRSHHRHLSCRLTQQIVVQQRERCPMEWEARLNAVQQSLTERRLNWWQQSTRLLRAVDQTWWDGMDRSDLRQVQMTWRMMIWNDGRTDRGLALVLADTVTE